MEENERNTKEAPKKFLDYNASWPLTILYLAFLAGIYLGQYATTGMFKTGAYNSYAFYFVSIFVGLIGSFFVYNLGKLVGIKVAKYDLVYISILGLTFDFTEKKTKVTFDIMRVFDLRMDIAPKDDNVEANPKPVFLGGIVAEAILVALMLVFFFVFGLNNTKTGGAYFFAWGFLFAVCYGFLTPLYELLPLRQDYPTDMYNILMTSDPEDRKAFNILKINRRRERKGQEYIVPEFASYDSYYKAHMLYYVYLQDLYEAKLQKASSVLEDMKYFAKYFDDDEKFVPLAEVVYLKYLVGDAEGARKAYLAIKKDYRKGVTDPDLLSLYRTAAYVLIDIHGDKAGAQTLVKKFDDVLAGYGEQHSNRVEREKAFFNSAYNKARALRPEFELEAR